MAVQPPADPRDTLLRLASDRGESLTALSAMIGRNQAYLNQFVRRGSPRALPERERRMLADHFGVGETQLGAEPSREELVRLPRLDVAASAGPGTTVDADVALGEALIPAALARRVGLREGSVIRVRGDSMAPGLLDGDQLVVDSGQRTPGWVGAIYIIRVDDVVMVKRVARAASGLRATSDNPAAAPPPPGPIDVIGKVVWQMRGPT